jgi:HrpA-like RNA helicase
MNSAPQPTADLPIRAYASRIVDAIRDNPITIVIGETGSGKTTQISQASREGLHRSTHARNCTQTAACSSLAHKDMLDLLALQILLEAGLAGKGQICVTQPRRVVSSCCTLRCNAWCRAGCLRPLH